MVKGAGLINAKIDWPQFISKFEAVKREELLPYISGRLLQVTPNNEVFLFSKYTDGSSREAYIRSAAIRLMSTPEYQMC